MKFISTWTILQGLVSDPSFLTKREGLHPNLDDGSSIRITPSSAQGPACSHESTRALSKSGAISTAAVGVRGLETRRFLPHSYLCPRSDLRERRGRRQNLGEQSRGSDNLGRKDCDAGDVECSGLREINGRTHLGTIGRNTCRGERLRIVSDPISVSSEAPVYSTIVTYLVMDGTNNRHSGHHNGSGGSRQVTSAQSLANLATATQQRSQHGSLHVFVIEISIRSFGRNSILFVGDHIPYR
jgi:hypothetical protein